MSSQLNKSALLSDWSKTDEYYDKYSDAQRKRVRSRLAKKLSTTYSSISTWNYPQVVNLEKLWEQYPNKVARDFRAGVFYGNPIDKLKERKAKAAEYAAQPPVPNSMLATAKKDWLMPAIGIGSVVLIGGIYFAKKNKDNA